MSWHQKKISATFNILFEYRVFLILTKGYLEIEFLTKFKIVAYKLGWHQN